MSRRFDLVLFDLDGTLVQTAPEIADAVNDTLRQFGWLGVDQDLVEGWIGQGTQELLLQALAHAQEHSPCDQPVRLRPTEETVTAAFDRHYESRCGTRSQLYPRVRETLNALHQRGTRLALVTNKEARYTQRVLRAHRLVDAFDPVICGDTLPTKKPDPAGVLKCLQSLGVLPERAVFVGDSSIDAATARNAGLPVWLLPYGYNAGQPIEACEPDRVIADISALLG